MELSTEDVAGGAAGSQGTGGTGDLTGELEDGGYTGERVAEIRIDTSAGPFQVDGSNGDSGYHSGSNSTSGGGTGSSHGMRASHHSFRPNPVMEVLPPSEPQ